MVIVLVWIPLLSLPCQATTWRFDLSSRASAVRRHFAGLLSAFMLVNGAGMAQEFSNV